MDRRIKIMANYGPAVMAWAKLEELILAGMDVLRINFSHVSKNDYPQIAGVIQYVRETAQKHGRVVGIFQDLGGIKLRIGDIGSGVVHLTAGEEVSIILGDSSSDPHQIPFPDEDIFSKFSEGDRVYLADGTICLDVLEHTGIEVRTRARNGGALSSRKGVNLPGVSIDRPVLTEKDKCDAQFGVEQAVDWIGLSFVRTALDVAEAKAFLHSIGSRALVMAKIEKGEAIDNIDGILEQVDGIMVARGDLGIEIPMEQVPNVQKMLLQKALEAGKVSNTATQMLRSMMTSPRPLRAEVSDIAQAVWQGTHSILLSDETAVGQFPVEVVRVAAATIVEAEKTFTFHPLLLPRGSTEIVVRSACQQVQAYPGSKIIVLTSTGTAAIATAKFQPEAPIIAITHTKEVAQKLTMVWGVYPRGVIPPIQDVSQLVALTIRKLVETGAVNPEVDKDVVIVFGQMPGVGGTTDTSMHIHIPTYLTGVQTLAHEVPESVSTA